MVAGPHLAQLLLLLGSSPFPVILMNPIFWSLPGGFKVKAYRWHPKEYEILTLVGRHVLEPKTILTAFIHLFNNHT